MRKRFPEIAVIFASLSILLTAVLYTLQTREIDSRRSQACVLFEREDRAKVQQIVRSYRYLERLPRSEWGTSLTKAVVQGLSGQYLEASASKAPAYCADPGIGLDESTAPRLPKEKNFNYLLKRPSGTG